MLEELWSHASVAEARIVNRLSRPIAQPKPSARLTDRIKYKREREEQARVFRSHVWSRDQGRCRVCRKAVKRTTGLDPLRGEVHHLRGRNVAPEARYDVSRAVLVCLACHVGLTQHKLTVPA